MGKGMFFGVDKGKIFSIDGHIHSYAFLIFSNAVSYNIVFRKIKFFYEILEAVLDVGAVTR